MAESKIEDVSFGDEEEEETYAEDKGSSAEDNDFDAVVGAIEEILLDDEFLSVQKQFCDENCGIFSDTEENKVEYTPIFEAYTSLMETAIERLLVAKIPGFNMRRFESILVSRQDEIGGEIFDLLLSLSDFVEFKGMMIAHRQAREGRASGAGPGALSVQGQHLNLTVGGSASP